MSDNSNSELTMESAIILFGDYLLDKGKSERTISGYCKHDLKKLVEWLDTRWSELETDQDLYVTSVTKTDIRDIVSFWKTNTSLAASSVNRQIAAVKSFFAFLYEQNYVPTNPALDITMKRIQRQNQIKWLTRQQVGRLFHVIETQQHAGKLKKVRDKAVVSVLVNSGVRNFELTNIKIQHVSEGSLLIHSGKGDKQRIIAIGSNTYRAIQEWLQFHEGDTEYLFYTTRESKLTTRAVQHILKKYSDMAGFVVTPHMLRHTFAKQLADRVPRLELIADILGHSSVDVSRIYVTPSMREMQVAIESVEFIG
ncbi:tyrosine-type recombinase/integrase [Paenibacillus xylanexedens]|uniref:tyrosine-type recombinase/integrase n=1 Tax=Paenibacillus xylanexedens TaxID=528191 RepID=UPI0011A3BDB3|nr:tyrosine-type recombinase/integrase [Paenibacillus xylanexedens]